MKVQITISELRAALRQLHTRDNGKATVQQAQAPEQLPEDLSPEEQIRRNPSLALDTPAPPLTIDQIQAELLRWFERPERARGRWCDVPHGHPSGFGGQKVYIPRDFPLPGTTK